MPSRSSESPETLSATTEVDAPAEAVFAVLTDPTSHPRIDGTGWVQESLDQAKLDHVGQVFRMAMFHENQPDKHYRMANRVEVLEHGRAIAWLPGQEQADGELLGVATLDLTNAVPPDAWDQIEGYALAREARSPLLLAGPHPVPPAEPQVVPEQPAGAGEVCGW